ncbi:MAG: NAD(P)-dependent oxidoreductase [Ethanoligenens sp.]|uniref:NAD(P)-dependent oxidoreductase n=1 Tax=Ethanoligenens sp. TaxID=2099655 RepID=UPI0039E7CB7A
MSNTEPVQKPRIGWIGLGVMGGSMAARLLNAGYPLSIYNRTKSKCAALIAQGAIWRENPAALARNTDIIITMVGYPSDVEQVYLEPTGILENACKGSTVIDMTTSKPSLAKRIYETAKTHGLNALDAPVSGGDVGARDGTLSIMVGGDQAVYDTMLPVFKAMGKTIVRQGDAGAGQHTKMCNQIAIAANIMGVCESLAYAKRAGLDPETVLRSIGGGGAASWQLSAYAPRILKGDYSPGFYIKHFLKDMRIALEEAEAMNLHTPALALSKSLYEKLSAKGLDDEGTQALFRLYQP